MNWYKRALKSKIRNHPQSVVDWGIRVLGIDINTGEDVLREKNKKKKPQPEKDCDCAHSMDIHCDGGDDGW